MKKIITVAITSTLLVILSLYAINAAIVGQQRNRQLEIAHTLLNHSENLSQNVALALKSTTTRGCDKSSLDDYRKIKLNSVFFSDIGFIEKGNVACTAFWGKLANPIPLPAALHTTPRGFILAQFSRKDFFSGNAVIYNNLIIFTSKYAYDKFIPVTENYSLASTTKDFGRTFFSVAPQSEQRSWLQSGLFTLTVVQCSSIWDLCVTVKHHDTGLASLPLAVFGLLGSFLYFIWFSLTLYSFRLYEDRFSLERTLVKAVQNNTISINYQPIIRVRDKKIVGVEVLSRWRDYRNAEVSPELFIPLIKKMGLYKKHYKNILEKSLAEIAPLAVQHQLTISLNVGRTEMEDRQFIHILRRACLRNTLPLSLIKIELSEKAVSSVAILDVFCQQLTALGVRISIDDFGVQNSNLARLSLLEYDEIKIDKSLVDAINERYKQDIFVIFSDALARLNKTLVFEGVESEAQYRFIADRYPDSLIQGWYFSKSLTCGELAKLLQ